MLNEGAYFIGIALTTYYDSGSFAVDFFDRNALTLNIMCDTHINFVELRASHEIAFHEQNTGTCQTHKSIRFSRSLIGCNLWTTMW